MLVYNCNKPDVITRNFGPTLLVLVLMIVYIVYHKEQFLSRSSSAVCRI